jgi:hypothetical protein
MEGDQGTHVRRFTRLLIAIIALQCGVIGMLVYYQRESLQRDLSLMSRSDHMIDELFPGLSQDVMIVSRQTTEIGKDVRGLQSQVSRVDERLSEVGQDIHGVGQQVGALDTTVKDFVGDKSGLIWGHALNPYVLIVLLAMLAASIPFWGRFYSRRQEEDTSHEGLSLNAGPFENVAQRLDTLQTLLERIQIANGNGAESGPELRSLMEQTERLIKDARVELIILSSCGTEAESDPEEPIPENLH